MKAQTIDWSSRPPIMASGLLAQARALEMLAAFATRAAAALLPAVAIVLGASWAAADPATAVYLQATLWASGFVFAGLALEAPRPAMAFVNLALGIAVQALAWMSARLAPELAIVAAALIGGWLAISILRR